MEMHYVVLPDWGMCRPATAEFTSGPTIRLIGQKPRIAEAQDSPEDGMQPFCKLLEQAKMPLCQSVDIEDLAKKVHRSAESL
ncbi:MAG: hypothetical protein ACOYM2_04355 [Rectinemataceae bacterium]